MNREGTSAKVKRASESAILRALTKPKFAAWLKARGRKKAGASGYLTSNETSWGSVCPIATYLQEVTGDTDIFVAWMFAESGPVAVCLPEWASRFISQYDNTVPENRDHLTGNRAAAILAEVA